MANILTRKNSLNTPLILISYFSNCTVGLLNKDMQTHHEADFVNFSTGYPEIFCRKSPFFSGFKSLPRVYGIRINYSIYGQWSHPQREGRHEQTQAIPDLLGRQSLNYTDCASAMQTKPPLCRLCLDTMQ